MTDPSRRPFPPLPRALRGRGSSAQQRRQWLRASDALRASEVQMLEGAEAFLAAAHPGAEPENRIGRMPVPLCIGEHLVVNGEARTVCMATEELGVIAGFCNAAKSNAQLGGITVTVAPRNAVRGQILFHNVQRAEYKAHQIEEYGDRYIRDAHARWDPMVKHGGGLTTIAPRVVLDASGRPTVAVDIVADTGECMGAAVVTRMARQLAADMQTLVEPLGASCICVNDRSGWHATAIGRWDFENRFDVVAEMLNLQAYAEQDASRAATHDKGVHNGVDAIALATGQDTRAVAASLYAYAASRGGMQPLTRLVNRVSTVVLASLDLWLPVGTVGGATGTPIARFCRDTMCVTGARDLAGLMAAAGLVQHIAALRMLADEGVDGALTRLRHP